MGPVQVLHFGKEIAKVFGMFSLTASVLLPDAFGFFQGRFFKQLAHGLVPRCLQRSKIYSDTLSDKYLICFVHVEELFGEAPKLIYRGLHALVAFVGTITQAFYPGG